jgi:Protein of unknown function (DUF4050)
MGSAPRDSTDTNARDRSNSPRFEGFRRRFRSSSNTNSVSSETLPTVEAEKLSGRTEALKAAKRFLLSTIRNDWAYTTGGVSDTLSGVHIESREPLDYRARVDGSSDFESDGPSQKRAAAAARRSAENDPYKFDSPDAIGTSIIEKKRKKRKLFEEEMVWNEGVRTYAKRRDKWTGATNRWPGKRKRMGPGFDTGVVRTGSDSTDVSVEWPLSSQSPNQPSSSTDSMNNPDEEAGPWLPVYPPLLPDDNPVRANITPNAYPTIYNKVVIQSLTPTVPIPLTHMTYALIEGWKGDGAWPPQGTAPVPSASLQGNKKSSGLLKFRKLRASSEKSRVKKGLSSVKKALVGEAFDNQPGVELDFEEEERLDAENSELNRGLLEGNSTRRHS